MQPNFIATGNIDCAVQIGQRTGVPVLHIVELIDWAQEGGPRPESLPTDLPENIA